MNTYLQIQPEVADALADGRPVVALESTIISHGMPYPRNIDMAARVEALVREHGAVPATIAVLDGCIQVGLDAEQIERLGHGAAVMKVSRRDLGYALASRCLGATTVSSTMIGAALAGIRVFVTGGIGGVHRGAEESFDISADLQELGQTAVAVVAAGAKSILDLPKTLEYLETMGVPVLGYKTDRFPAFFTRDSGLPVVARLDSAAAVVAAMAAHWGVGLRSGLLIANPVPTEFAMAGEEIDSVIATAVAEARSQGVRGKDETPFLLKRIVELTDGRSLATNIALVENNARIGAQIAVAWASRLN
jgi:pseudouridine-5'-phosphate glycosidase